MTHIIKLGTRGSKLALTQSRWVAQQIQHATGIEVELIVIVTRGDTIQNKPLPEVGGKGLFTAELEQGLREGTIDIAVHSLKDLPTENPEGLCIGAIPKREDPRDALVGSKHPKIIGTGSLRRQEQIQNHFGKKTIDIQGIRGNVDTRLSKLDTGLYDSIILAMAGLRRLGIERNDIQPLSCQQMVPAPAQGALGIQSRSDDAEVLSILANIHHDETARCVQAERKVLEGIGGGCHTPIGCHIQKLDEKTFEGFFFDGTQYRHHRSNSPDDIVTTFLSPL
jgi:hydroxymethylbilane synthase